MFGRPSLNHLYPIALIFRVTFKNSRNKQHFLLLSTKSPLLLFFFVISSFSLEINKTEKPVFLFLPSFLSHKLFLSSPRVLLLILFIRINSCFVVVVVFFNDWFCFYIFIYIYMYIFIFPFYLTHTHNTFQTNTLLFYFNNQNNNILKNMFLGKYYYN